MLAVVRVEIRVTGQVPGTEPQNGACWSARLQVSKQGPTGEHNAYSGTCQAPSRCYDKHKNLWNSHKFCVIITVDYHYWGRRKFLLTLERSPLWRMIALRESLREHPVTVMPDTLRTFRHVVGHPTLGGI